MKPLVSIIIPAYNAGAFIEETLDSLVGQTHGNWEAIVADDGSGDNTAQIVAEIARGDSRIRLVRLERIGHAGAVRNAAMREAGGDYIAFLDSDDLWLPRKLELQLKTMEGISRPGICYTGSESFDDGPVPYRREYPNTPPPATREAQYEDLLLRGHWYNTSSFLLTREFAEEIGPFSEEPALRSGQDSDYLMRALFRRPLIYVPEVLTRVRNRAGSLTARHRRDWNRYFALYEGAEARGEIPAELLGRCRSIPFTVKGEALLAEGAPGWRRAFWRAWRHDPLNWRRWPALPGSLLPAPMMRAYYAALKRLQGGAK